MADAFDAWELSMQLVEQERQALHWIVLESHGMWEMGDMAGEIAMALLELRRENEEMPAQAIATGEILRRLRRTARRNGRTFRKAQRLNETLPGGTSTRLDHLPDTNGENPLSRLEAQEDPPPPAPEMPPPYACEAAAWHWLAWQFGRTTAIAAYLLISPSWCRRRRLRARLQLQHQHALARGFDVTAGTTQAITPWRRFKLPARIARQDRQLQLDYWHKPEQPTLGQLWLL